MSRYGVIIADPPWQYGGGGKTFKGAAEHHYETMSLKSIKALPVGDLAAPDSVLLLWATWPLLEAAMLVIPAWGFEYVTGFPWIKIQGPPQVTLSGEWEYKPSYGVGFWVRGCSEVVLVARKGAPEPSPASFVGLLSERFHHSRKPQNLYEYAETMPGPYLELFARRQRQGWDSFGNEVESSISLERPE